MFTGSLPVVALARGGPNVLIRRVRQDGKLAVTGRRPEARPKVWSDRVRGEERTMSTERIVVGVDGSTSSKQALRWAHTMADRLGAELVVVTTWAPPLASFGMLIDKYPTGSGVDIQSETRAALEILVKETLGDVQATLEVVEGQPATVLRDVAEGATLLVVGSRGHGAITGALLGSVSQYLVGHAHCPVVVVKQ